MLKPLISYHQLQEMTGIPIGSLYSMVHRRVIPHVRIGPRNVRFQEDEVLAWIKARQVVVAKFTTSLGKGGHKGV